jgi:biotin operon repressor
MKSFSEVIAEWRETRLSGLTRTNEDAASPAVGNPSKHKEQDSVQDLNVGLRELHERRQATPGELADALGLTRGAVSKIIDKLEAKGWIQADAKESDNRYRLLSLTRAGQGFCIAQPDEICESHVPSELRL